MTQPERQRHLRIGIFATIAFVLFVFGIFIAGKKDGFFTSFYTLVAEFKNVQGLKTGQSVWLNGLAVGQVTAMRFGDPQEQVIEVVLSIEPQFQPWIRQDSVATIGSKGILGDKVINISMGTGQQPILEDGAQIPTAPAADIGDFLAEAGDVVTSVKEFLKTLDKIGKNMVAGQGTLGKLVSDDKLYNEVEGAVRELRQLISGIRGGKGTVGKLVVDAGVYNKLDRILGSLDRGEGTLGKILKDDEFYNTLHESVTALKTILQAIESAEGSVGKLVMEPDLHNKINDVLRSIETLSEDIRKHPERYIDVSVF